MKKFSEKTERSMLKALTFRILVIIFDSVTILLLTGKVGLTIHVVTVTTLIHTLIYFYHERAWNGIHWGKHTHLSRH